MVYININIYIYTTVTYAAKIFTCMIYYIYCAKWVVFAILFIYIAQTIGTFCNVLCIAYVW